MSVLFVMLWIVLSVILLGATFWSAIILHQQKQAWRIYADKKSLTYSSRGFFDSATVEGVVDGYNVSFFNATQQNPDARKNRQLTVMQVTANTSFVDGLATGTAEMVPFLQSLKALTPHDLKEGKLTKGIDLRTRHKKALDTYLTAERVTVINSIMSMPNADILIILDDREGVFRFETPNPLKDAGQIESLVSKLIVRIKVLEPNAAEAKNLAEIVKGAGPDVVPESLVQNEPPKTDA